MPKVKWSQGWLRATGAAFALAGLTALIAMAAGAPLSLATPIDATSARAPATALFMLMTGAGIVGRAALVVVVWPGGRRPEDDDFERVPEVDTFAEARDATRLSAEPHRVSRAAYLGIRPRRFCQYRTPPCLHAAAYSPGQPALWNST
jgi:hypothetical protein